MKRMVWLLCLVSAGAMAQSPALAQKAAKLLSARETAIFESELFIQTHPDLLFLRDGIQAYRNKSYRNARDKFHIAGLYGEKMAQAMLAEMHWKGEGGAVDRPRAYALMDIAAERGTNASLIGIREKYWAELSESERDAALKLGPEILSRYSDEVAQRKLAAAFRADKASRLRVSPGLVQEMIVSGSAGDGTMSVRPDQFYDRKFWNASEYMALRDELTNRILRNGRVRVQFGGKVDGAPGQLQDRPKD